MKKILAIIFWSDWCGRCNIIGLVGTFAFCFINTWPCFWLTQLFRTTQYVGATAVLIRHLRLRRSIKIYDASHEVALRHLRELRQPTGSAYVLESRFEQTEAAIAAHDKVAADLRSRWLPDNK